MAPLLHLQKVKTTFYQLELIQVRTLLVPGLPTSVDDSVLLNQIISEYRMLTSWFPEHGSRVQASGKVCSASLQLGNKYLLLDPFCTLNNSNAIHMALHTQRTSWT